MSWHGQCAKHEAAPLTGCWAESLRVVGEKQQADRTLVSADQPSHCNESLLTRACSEQYSQEAGSEEHWQGPPKRRLGLPALSLMEDDSEMNTP